VEREIGNSNEVAVVDLRIVGRAFVEMVTESHFDKTYEADVEFGRNLVDEDIDKIRSLEGVTILQQTPKRVAHRRANLVRHRKIKHVEVVEYETQNPRLETEDPKLGIQNPKLATITIRAEAGTYIKELISGDGGRTKPSISELLNTKAECKKLNVSGMDDGFLDFCLANYAH
jgi:tRNA pseudouridine synthase 10